MTKEEFELNLTLLGGVKSHTYISNTVWVFGKLRMYVYPIGGLIRFFIDMQLCTESTTVVRQKALDTVIAHLEGKDITDDQERV